MTKIIQKKARAHRWNTVEATIEYDYKAREGVTLKEQMTKTFTLLDEVLNLQVDSLEKWANDSWQAKLKGENTAYSQSNTTSKGVSEKERKALFAKVKNSDNKIKWEKTWWNDLVKEDGRALALKIEKKLNELTDE